MPSSPRSLRLTEAFRRRLLALGARAGREAEARWPSIEAFDQTDWPAHTAILVTRAQRDGVRLTAGYVAAFIRSEGGRGGVPVIDSRRYAGLSRDGKPLAEALVSPLIVVRVALKQGRSPDEALSLGLTKATRRVAFEVVQSARDALVDTVEADERLTGFRRSVAGTCAACMALSGTSGPRFEVHPGCQCVPMPTVRGAVERIALPSGTALFGALTKADQEKAIGIEPARLVRDGEADLKDFVAHSRLEEQADFLTQKPTEQVAT